MLPKIGFSLQVQYDRPIGEIITLLKQAGFSAVSPIFSPEVDLQQIDACVRALGMTIQSLHAPNRVAPLWSDGTTPEIFDEVMACIDTCAKFHIPVMVLHSWQGLIYTFPDEPLYFENFDRIVAYAQQQNVSVAFENLEGEEYLQALMTRYIDCPHVGFCWDSGHENCYPHRLRFLEEFGDRLMMTHLHDNFGLRSPDGAPSGRDDLHYIPGDGKIDWKNNLRRLAKSKRQEVLNFELKLRPETMYSGMSAEEFINRAGCHARRIAETYADILSPTRKPLRMENYDYSTPGAYFITICTANSEKLFWSTRRGDLWSPVVTPVSDIGKIVKQEIDKLNTVYDSVHVDKYCIMPDHIHMILSIRSAESGRTQFAPTVSRAIKQFKGSVTKQIGKSIWQKSFYEHVIRNQQDYDETWEYIENNPLKYLLKKAP